MAQKADLIAGIRFAYDEILAFAGELSEEERATPGLADHWAARDILAHLGNSNRQMAETLAAGFHGEPPPAGISNEEGFLRYKTWTWEDILTMIRWAYDSIFDQVQAVGEQELNAPVKWLDGRTMWRAIAGNSFVHSCTHLVQVFIERGDRARALRLNERAKVLGEHLDDSPEWQGLFLYNTGCFYALMGEKRLALENLEKGISLSPRLAGFSKQDTDLVSLHGDADFLAMLERVSVPG